MHTDDFTDTSPQVVDLRLQDLNDAARAGILTEQQGRALWHWLGQAGAQRHSTPRAAQPASPASGPKFGFVNVLYYFGGMVAISAMGSFMTLGFQSMGVGGLLAISLAYLFACLKVADNFKARGLAVPAGILATLAVVLVPLAVWSVQSLLGLWPPGGQWQFFGLPRLYQLALDHAGICHPGRWCGDAVALPAALHGDADCGHRLVPEHGCGQRTHAERWL
jgi:hypothetical protein